MKGPWNIANPLTDDGRNKINEMFQELYNEYREAGLNAKVARNKAEQAVADALIAKETAEVTREEMLEIIREQTRNGDLAPEIAQARQGHETLGENLNSIKTQLAQTDDKFNLENWELNSKSRRKQGLVVFISDDAHRGDWDVLKPIFESEGVPFCLSVVSSHPDTRSDILSWEELRYLQNEMGCEILSHSKSHQLSPPITEMPSSFVHSEYRDSKKDLTMKGLNVQSYRVPGGIYGVRERILARDYYRAMVVSDPGEDGLNHTPLESHDLKSIWLDNESYGGAKSFEYYKDHIDRANEHGALLIISTHGYALDGLHDLFAQVVSYANQEAKVTTLADALNRIGNIVEAGDFSRNSRIDREGRSHFVLGSDGRTSGTLNFRELDEIDGHTSWLEIPFGETVNMVSEQAATETGLPGPGVLRTLKFLNHQYSFGYQEIRLHGTLTEYWRRFDADGKFFAWMPKPKILTEYEADKSFSTGIRDYSVGITQEIVYDTDKDIHLAPEGRAGIRRTYKLVESEAWGFNIQEYILPYHGYKKYYRRAIDAETWSEWTDLTSYSRVDNESYDLNSGISDFPLGQTISFIEPSDPTINKAPEESAGTLITYRVRESGYWGFNYQEYHLNFKADRLSVYKRRAESASSWGDWVLVSKE